MSLRDYDKYTPRERQDRMLLRAELRAKDILTEKSEQTAARAQAPDRASPKPCQENSVDAGVSGEAHGIRVGWRDVV